MRLSSLILTVLVMIVLVASESRGQVIPGVSYSGSLESYYQSWEIKDGETTTNVNQLIVPIGLFLPVTDRLDVRLATSYASFARETADGGTESVSGLTDVRIQANFAVLSRKLLIGLVANIPTGKGELSSVQQDIVFNFISPDLSVRSNRLGEGFNAGGTLTYAAPLSQSAILSLASGLIVRGAYDTSLPTSDGPFRLDPGLVASGSAGIDFFTEPGHFRLSSTFTYYGTEQVDGADHYRIGPEVATVANYSHRYAQSKGRLTAGIHQIIRLDNSVTADDSFGKEPLSTNGSYLSASLGNEYFVARTIRVDVSALIRLVGKNELDVGDATVFEGGLGVTYVASPGVALTIGGRYVTGTGTGLSGLDREIKGLEGAFRLVAQLPK